MEWVSDSPCLSHTYPGQGRRSPGRGSSCKLKFRDCGEIPGQGLLLTAERRIERMWGRRLWWEKPVEESQAAMEARQYGWVTCRGWSHHHGLSLCTRLHQQLDNREAGLQTPDTLNYRVGPHQGVPLSAWWANLQSRTPARGSPLCVWHTEQQRRTPGKGTC